MGEQPPPGRSPDETLTSARMLTHGGSTWKQADCESMIWRLMAQSVPARPDQSALPFHSSWRPVRAAIAPLATMMNMP